MRARIILAVAVILASAPAIAAETNREHAAIRERNAKEIAAHLAEMSRHFEISIRSNVREECKLDRLHLDIDTCNRLSGLDRFFKDGPNRRTKN
jgi:hypothetical protein